MSMITDIIDCEIKVGDFVVFYSNIYQVQGLGKANANGGGYVKIMIWNGGETAKPVNKHSKEIALLDRNAVVLWQIKQGS